MRKGRSFMEKVTARQEKLLLIGESHIAQRGKVVA
jgi:hypothetical protein